MEYPKNEEDEKKIKMLLEHYKRAGKENIFEVTSSNPDNLTLSNERLTIKYKRRFLFCLQFKELMHRETIHSMRDKNEIRAKIFR